MASRRFGPTKGAGVVIIEKDGDKTIEAGALGISGYAGVLQKGRTNELIEILNKNDFTKKCGTIIDNFFTPDVVLGFFKKSNSTGRVYLKRITDGTEVKATLNLKNRRAIQSDVVQIDADNGGRWGGKKTTIVKDYVSITQTTLTTGITMLKDQYKDAVVTLNAVTTKTYKVISNDVAGVLTFDSDVTLQDDVGASSDQLYSAVLSNGTVHVSVLVKDGLKNPTTEWGLEVYVDDVEVRNYENLSSDPTSEFYFINVINDDTSNFYISVTDLWTGSITADIRPANYNNQSTIITTTKLTAEIFNVVNNSVAGAIGALILPTYGTTIVKDTVTLTNSATGTRSDEELTSTANYADTETVLINGRTITFKTVVADASNEVLVGATEEDSIDNLVTFINADVDPLVKDILFAEKDTSSILHLYAANANAAADAITTTTTAANATWGAATLSGGVDQTWNAVSTLQGALTNPVISGVVYVKENEYSLGFTLIDRTFDSTKMFAISDTVTIEVEPFIVDEFKGFTLIPDTSNRRNIFIIDSNTTFEINVKSGNDLTAVATAGDTFMVKHTQELAGGYDGTSSIIDQNYIDAFDTSSSLFNQLLGKNVGLVKMGCPGITTTVVQKAGVTYAQSRNYQWRYEIPFNITTESAAEEHINDTLGRNDFAVTTFPSFVYVTDPLKEGLKLIPAIGMIHGAEALVANQFQGYHKAQAGIDVILPDIVKLPTGDAVLDEEFLNPEGINIIKKVQGNFILWGDRTVSLDTNWKWKHQREYMSHQENILRENFDWIVFAINSANSSTQPKLITSLKIHFTGEFDKGALEGASFDDAVSIKVDGEINTTITRAAGDLNVEIRFRIVDTVERLKITMSKLGIFESIE